MAKKLSRRDFLSGAGALLAGAVLAACDPGQTQLPAGTPGAEPSATPTPVAAMQQSATAVIPAFTPTSTPTPTQFPATPTLSVNQLISRLSVDTQSINLYGIRNGAAVGKDLSALPAGTRKGIYYDGYITLYTPEVGFSNIWYAFLMQDGGLQREDLQRASGAYILVVYRYGGKYNPQGAPLGQAPVRLDAKNPYHWFADIVDITHKSGNSAFYLQLVVNGASLRADPVYIAPAFALTPVAGDTSNGGGNSGDMSGAGHKCPDGQIWDPVLGCIKEGNS